MQPRMDRPVMTLPGAMEALRALSRAAHGAGVPAETLDLVHMRASQVNGCSVCVTVHAAALKRAGESDERIHAVGAWRDAPYFTDAERAALALAEAVTRIADEDGPVPDGVWDEVARHYDEKALAALVVSIASVNTWNRLDAGARQVAGTVG